MTHTVIDYQCVLIGASTGIIPVVSLLLVRKTDQTGERRIVKSLILDHREDSLSDARELKEMLDGDSVLGDQTKVALSRKPRMGTEVTNEESCRASNVACIRQDELASGLHSLRIGGAAAYANAPGGGEMIAGFMAVRRKLDVTVGMCVSFGYGLT